MATYMSSDDSVRMPIAMASSLPSAMIAYWNTSVDIVNTHRDIKAYEAEHSIEYHRRASFQTFGQITTSRRETGTHDVGA